MSKVAITQCEGYEPDRVRQAVGRAVDMVGGIGQFVKPGMTVLVKPNLLSARLPEEAVDTHPEVVRAVVRIVKDAGGQPIIGDSPGGYCDNANEVFEKSGMRAIAKDEDVELVKFTRSRLVQGMPISKYIFEAGCVISVPKLKTHCLTLITAAIKNMYGAVVGLHKTQCHSNAPREDDFAKIVARVHSVARPHLTVVDAIEAMEGDGPSSGEVRRMNLVLAGKDAVAIDSVIAKIIGIDPLDVLVTKEAYQLGLGEADLSKIEVAGGDIAAFLVKDFKLPQTLPLKYVPRSVAKGIASFVRFKPFIDIDVCARCNLCKLTCPVGAIDIEEDGCSIDYKKCIRCLCCHEVCPYKAIRIKRNILTKMIWG